MADFDNTTLGNMTSNIIPTFTQGDFGFYGSLIPLVLVLAFSWFLSKKVRDVMFIQFPLTLTMKVIFPFFHISFVIISLAIFVMNLIGSKGDLLADIKEQPQKIRDRLREHYTTNVQRATKLAKLEDQKQIIDNLKRGFRRVR